VKYDDQGTAASTSLTRWLSAALGVMGLRNARTHERRRHPRSPAEVAGALDDAVVWVANLTAAGAGLVGPRPVDLGAKVGLTVELPMMDGHIHTTRLRLTVTACRPDLESAQGWRIGGTIVPVSDFDRIALVEYCHLAAACFRFSERGGARAVALPRKVREPALAAHS